MSTFNISKNIKALNLKVPKKSKYKIMSDKILEKCKLNTIFECISDKFHDLVIYPLKSIKYGLSNFWRFKQVIWSWRGWDYSYTLELWSKSSEELYKYYSNKSNVHMIEVQRKEIVLICKNLNNVLDKLIKDDYFPNKEYNKLKKYQKTKRTKTELGWRMEFTYKGMSEKEYTKQLKALYKEEIKNRKKDVKVLYKILKDDIEKVWD